MKIEINTFDELIDFIENSNLSLEEYDTIISNTLSVFIDIKELTKQNLIMELKAFWSKYKNQLEKPLFLNEQFSKVE
jgi:hypothetical protein